MDLFTYISLGYFGSAAGAFALWIDAKRHGNGIKLGIAERERKKRFSGRGILMFLTRLIILYFCSCFGEMAGALVYSPNHGFADISLVLDPRGVLAENTFGLWFPGLWSVSIPTILWELLCLWSRAPWWGFVFPFVGNGFLAYGSAFSWYTP